MFDNSLSPLEHYYRHSSSTRTFLAACYEDDAIPINTLRNLLENSEERPDINAISLEGEPVLHLAIYKKRLDLMRFLLDNGADANACNTFRQTALLKAIFYIPTAMSKKDRERADVTYIQLLLEHGADPNKEDDDRYTPLSMAVQFRLVNVIKLLLEKGADVNKTVDCRKFSPLHWAVELSIIRILIEKGANLNALNTEKQTPLMLIAAHTVKFSEAQRKRRDIKCLGELIWAGANTDIKILETTLSQDQFKEANDIINTLNQAKQDILKLQQDFLHPAPVEEKQHQRPPLPQELVDLILGKPKELFQESVDRIIEEYIYERRTTNYTASSFMTKRY